MEDISLKPKVYLPSRNQLNKKGETLRIELFVVRAGFLVPSNEFVFQS